MAQLVYWYLWLSNSSQESKSYANRLQQKVVEVQLFAGAAPIPKDPLPIKIPKEQVRSSTPSRNLYSIRTNIQDLEKHGNLEKRLALQREKYKILENKNKQLQAKLDQIEGFYESKIRVITGEINELKNNSGNSSQIDSVLEELASIKEKLQRVEEIASEINHV